MERLMSITPTWMQKVLNREIILYGFFGVMTTFVNIFIFQAGMSLGIAYGAANIIAVLVAKVFAYVTNKLYVFEHKCKNWKELAGEILRFVFARGFTGVIDIAGIFVAVELLCMDKMLAKCMLQFLVIVLNYVLGKRMVFKK